MGQAVVDSKRIKKAVLYKLKNKLYQRLSIWPFLAIYPIWIASIFIYYETLYEKSLEFISLVTALLCAMNSLAVLSCRWNIHVNCLLNMNKTRTVSEADFLKVTTDSNKVELLELKRSSKGAVYFFYRKRKYLYSAEKNAFKKLQYSKNMSFQTFLEAKGFNDSDSVNEALELYGPNR